MLPKGGLQPPQSSPWIRPWIQKNRHVEEQKHKGKGQNRVIDKQKHNGTEAQKTET